MTSAIELRQQQQLIVTSRTASLGVLAGETFSQGQVVDSPGLLYSAVGLPRREQLLLLDAGASIRGISLGGAVTPLADIGLLGFALAPDAGEVFYGVNQTTPALSVEIPLDQLGVGDAINVPKLLVTVRTQEQAPRITEPRPPTWTINNDGAQSLISSTGTTPHFLQRARQLAAAYNALAPDTPLPAAWGGQFGVYITGSTKRQEALPYNVASVRAVVVLNRTSFGENFPTVALRGPGGWQFTRYVPSNIIPAPTLRLTARFGEDGDYADTVLSLPNATTPSSHVMERGRPLGSDSPPSTRVRLFSNSFRLLVERVSIPFPLRLSDTTRSAFKLTNFLVSDVTDRNPALYVFAHAAPIQIPSNATVSGTRPNERLTYSGGWDRSFKLGRCRCPVWILYHVLTAEAFGIELPPARLDLQSFYIAARYCQRLVDGAPRWTFDGPLRGTQNTIVQQLLDCMGGLLTVTQAGQFALVVEQPARTTRIICPATVVRGDVTYRRAQPRPPVRATYRDRLTAEERVTPGLLNSRFESVPFGDRAVAERWAAWRTFTDQNLLDSMEATMGWEAHDLRVGDIVGVWDPAPAGVRTAGRILSSAADGSWVQLDRLPLELWPSEVAAARLLHDDPRAAVDPDTWGFVQTDLSNVWLRLQYQRVLVPGQVNRIAWRPGGPDSQNRVYYTTVIQDFAPPPRTPWALATDQLHPTLWRVQSVAEAAEGTQFKLTATRYLDGMHAHVEEGVALPVRNYRWKPECGNKLSLFRGPFTELNQRYPKPGSAPFGDPGVFTDLTTSCPR